jgi:hypothetical protein
MCLGLVDSGSHLYHILQVQRAHNQAFDFKLTAQPVICSTESHCVGATSIDYSYILMSACGIRVFTCI